MPYAFTPAEIALILLIYLAAATAKGVTGLGFSTACLPFLTLAVGLKPAMALVILPSLASNLAIMRAAGHFGETVRGFAPMLLATLPGIAAGLWLLTAVDGARAGGVLGAVLIAYVAFALAAPDWRLRESLARPLQPVSGFLTGTVNGLTGSQVMPALPFLLSLGLDRDRFVQAINCSFTLSSLAMAAGLSAIGLFTPGIFAVSLAGIGAALIGVRLGGRVRHRLSPAAFRRAVLAVLAAMGCLLVLRAF